MTVQRYRTQEVAGSSPASSIQNAVSKRLSNVWRVERSSSYRLRDFSDVPAELARLDAQAAAIWTKEAETLRRQGLAPTARVLEIGCGPGFATERLLELVPDGWLTAIDVDSEMVSLARNRLRDRERVEVVEASVTALPFADDSFDAVTARLVLEHIPDPAPALREARRVLVQGGRLFVVEVDDGWPMLTDPEPPVIAELNAAGTAMIEARGADRRLGRRLPQLLTDFGFTDVAFDVVTLHTAVDDATALRQMLNPTVFLQQLEEANVVTGDTLASIRKFVAQYESGDIRLEFLLAAFMASAAA
jgi:SAM-dependent methyltransferase